MRISTGKRQKPGFINILQVTFFFIFAANLSYSDPLLGDVNSDQVIDTVDALMVAQYYAQIPVPGFNADVADVDNNKKIDIIDALLISRYAAEMIEFFPALPQNWEAIQHYIVEGDVFKDALVKKGFAVLASPPYNTLTAAYSEFSGNYNLPAFITTDALLHLFHITFAHMLKTAEEQYMTPRMKVIAEQLDTYAKAEYDILPEGTSLKTAAEQLMIFTAVASALINGETEFTQAENDPVLQAANAFLEKIYTHTAVEPYPGLDYTQFTPRGHYAGDAVLEQYFRTFRWMQKYFFLIDNSSASSESGLPAAGILGNLIHKYPVLSAYWNDIDQFITGMFGPGTGLSPLMVDEAMLTLFPAYPQQGYSLLSEQTNLDLLQATLLTGQYPPEKSVRLIANPLLLDHNALAKTIIPYVVDRCLPEGLDAAATVFGSDTAYNLLLSPDITGTTMGTQLKNQINTLIAEYNSLSAASWETSVQSRWFAALRSLSEPPAASAPGFMQTGLWKKEKLNTQLASWAELHANSVNLAPTPFPTSSPTPTPAALLGDVNDNGQIDIIDALLVAQYSVGINPSGFDAGLADANQDGQVNVIDALIIAQYYVGLITQIPPVTPPPTPTPTPPPGFVEPYPDFYSRYKEMCTRVIDVIDTSGFQLSHSDRFADLYAFADRFQQYSETLAAGERLSQTDYEYIRTWELTLQSFMANSSFIPEKIARTHVISDILTYDEQTLHIATGKLHPVIVTYYVPGEIYPFAGIGFVMSYYEFTENGVITNSDWEQKLNSAPPSEAPWCSEYIVY